MKEFIETLRSRLKDLQCLSCAKTFKDRNTLKDHMRKKSHRGLNKDDRSFDKFYLINYLEMGKRWTQVCFGWLLCELHEYLYEYDPKMT